MTNFIEFQVEGNGNNDFDGEFHKENHDLSLDSFIDYSTYENNRLDYYGFKNVRRSVNSAEEDAFSESDVKYLCEENVEVQNYCEDSEDEMSQDKDNFDNSNQKMNILIKHL